MIAAGARYFTVVQRWSLFTNCQVAAPLGQRVPSLIGESGCPWMSMILPWSSTMTIWAQPTEQ